MTFSTRRTTRYFTHARAAIAAVAVTGALLGCGGSDKSTGPGGIAGKYNIVSVNGPAGLDNSAPFTVFNQTIEGSNLRAEITSGFINLGSDGRYSGNATVKVFLDDVLFSTDDSFGGVGSSGGTYKVNGNQVTFTPDDTSEQPETATLSGGNTLTFVTTEDDPDLGPMTFTIVARK